MKKQKLWILYDIRALENPEDASVIFADTDKNYLYKFAHEQLENWGNIVVYCGDEFIELLNDPNL